MKCQQRAEHSEHGRQEQTKEHIFPDLLCMASAFHLFTLLHVLSQERYYSIYEQFDTFLLIKRPPNDLKRSPPGAGFSIQSRQKMCCM